jgi:hypothetical protein
LKLSNLVQRANQVREEGWRSGTKGSNLVRPPTWHGCIR